MAAPGERVAGVVGARVAVVAVGGAPAAADARRAHLVGRAQRRRAARAVRPVRVHAGGPVEGVVGAGVVVVAGRRVALGRAAVVPARLPQARARVRLAGVGCASSDAVLVVAIVAGAFGDRPRGGAHRAVRLGARVREARVGGAPARAVVVVARVAVALVAGRSGVARIAGAAHDARLVAAHPAAVAGAGQAHLVGHAGPALVVGARVAAAGHDTAGAGADVAVGRHTRVREARVGGAPAHAVVVVARVAVAGPAEGPAPSGRAGTAHDAAARCTHAASVAGRRRARLVGDAGGAVLVGARIAAARRAAALIDADAPVGLGAGVREARVGRAAAVAVVVVAVGAGVAEPHRRARPADVAGALGDALDHAACAVTAAGLPLAGLVGHTGTDRIPMSPRIAVAPHRVGRIDRADALVRRRAGVREARVGGALARAVVVVAGVHVALGAGRARPAELAGALDPSAGVVAGAPVAALLAAARVHHAHAVFLVLAEGARAGEGSGVGDAAPVERAGIRRARVGGAAARAVVVRALGAARARRPGEPLVARAPDRAVDDLAGASAAARAGLALRRRGADPGDVAGALRTDARGKVRPVARADAPHGVAGRRVAPAGGRVAAAAATAGGEPEHEGASEEDAVRGASGHGFSQAGRDAYRRLTYDERATSLHDLSHTPRLDPAARRLRRRGRHPGDPGGAARRRARRARLGARRWRRRAARGAEDAF